MVWNDRIRQVRKYIQKKWFNLALIVLAGLLVLNKDLSIRFNIKAPLQKEKTSLPGVKTPRSSPKHQKQPPKITENLGSALSTVKSQGAIADPFSIFAPASIPESNGLQTTSSDYEFNQVSIEQVNSFVDRFGDVARNEMAKFKVPASVILAQSLLASHAGVNQVAKTANNFFSLHCGIEWDETKIEFSGQCYRKYETAWFSFRDHSKYVTSGGFRHLTNLDPTDYKRWAKGLELAGYSSVSGYSESLIETIQEFNLDRFDY